MKIYILSTTKIQAGAISESEFWVANPDKSEFFLLGNAFKQNLLEKFAEYVNVEVISLSDIPTAQFIKLMQSEGYKLPG